jgi:hypothetical protein
MYAELHDTPTHAKPRVKVRVRAHAHLRERALPRALGQVWPSAGGCKTASRKKFISSRRVSRVRCARVITEPREFAIVLIIIVSGQTVNRFAYVMNNPLSYTDPSGYFSWRKFLGKTIIRIVAAVADAFGCSGYCSMAVNAYYGYKSGGVAGFFASFIPGSDNVWANAAIDAAKGCVVSSANGGSCGRGAAGGVVGGMGGDNPFGQMLAGCISARINRGSCGDGAADALGSIAAAYVSKSAVKAWGEMQAEAARASAGGGGDGDDYRSSLVACAGSDCKAAWDILHRGTCTTPSVACASQMEAYRKASERIEKMQAITSLVPDVLMLAASVTPVGGGVTLYRSVSSAELATLGKGFSIGGGAEGKYFAETLVDAAAWGRQLGNPHIVEVTVSKSVADSMYRWQKLDNIGPARFAPIDALKDASIRVIR